MPNDYHTHGEGWRLQTDRDHIWHPFTSLAASNPPVYVESAHGVYLHTAEGKKIIDAVSSWWVNIHGHSHPVIAKALYDQALALEHVIFAGFTHKPAIALTHKLLSILPDNQQRLFFSDNGSTAVEVALKMALQFWFNKGTPRTRIIALEGAYHGDTFGAMAVGGRGMFTKPFHPLLFDVAFIEVPAKHNFESVLAKFRTLVSGGEVGAFIYEPLVQGAAGMVMYDATLLDALIREAKQHGVICIADEVFTGFGRTGTHFASLQLTTPPDIMAVSKGITGGTMPLGVTSCSRQVEDAFLSPESRHTFFHGHSYTANPLACAAALASFDLLMRPECRESIQRIARDQRDFALKVPSHAVVKEARCCGTILAIEIRTDENTSYFNNLRSIIYDYFLERDILLRPLGNVIYVLPPYVITQRELRHVHDTISEFLDHLGSREK